MTASNFMAQRRQLLKFGVPLALGGIGGLAAAASWQPAGVVRIIVPFAAGGGADALARLASPGLGDRFRQPVVVENRPGATGAIGADFVFSAPADGLTLLLGSADGLSMYPHIAKTRFDATRFTPIAPLGRTPFILMGRPDLPAGNSKELVALAQSRSLTYANAGNGSSLHVMAVAFKDAAQIKEAVQVPYQGAAPALQALMASQVDVMMVPAGMAGPYMSRLKSFGVTTASRYGNVKDVPTLSEQGVAVVGESWLGIVGPPGLSADATASLSEAIREVTRSTDYRVRLDQLGLSWVDMSQGEFQKYYLDAYKHWGNVIAKGNIKLE